MKNFIIKLLSRPIPPQIFFEFYHELFSPLMGVLSSILIFYFGMKSVPLEVRLEIASIGAGACLATLIICMIAGDVIKLFLFNSTDEEETQDQVSPAELPLPKHTDAALPTTTPAPVAEDQSRLQ